MLTRKGKKLQKLPAIDPADLQAPGLFEANAEQSVRTINCLPIKRGLVFHEKHKCQQLLPHNALVAFCIGMQSTGVGDRLFAPSCT